MTFRIQDPFPYYQVGRPPSALPYTLNTKTLNPCPTSRSLKPANIMLKSARIDRRGFIAKVGVSAVAGLLL